MPPRLLAFANVIRHLNPENQHIPYIILNWERYFRGDIDFLEITQNFPNQISRQNVINLSREAINNHAQTRKAFLATMIWGYGESGCGPWRTRQTLNNEQAPQMLQRAVIGLHGGQILDVYQNFKLRYCGPLSSLNFSILSGLAVI